MESYICSSMDIPLPRHLKILQGGQPGCNGFQHVPSHPRAKRSSSCWSSQHSNNHHNRVLSFNGKEDNHRSSPDRKDNKEYPQSMRVLGRKNLNTEFHQVDSEQRSERITQEIQLPILPSGQISQNKNSICNGFNNPQNRQPNSIRFSLEQFNYQCNIIPPQLQRSLHRSMSANPNPNRFLNNNRIEEEGKDDEDEKQIQSRVKSYQTIDQMENQIEAKQQQKQQRNEEQSIQLIPGNQQEKTIMKKRAVTKPQKFYLMENGCFRLKTKFSLKEIKFVDSRPSEVKSKDNYDYNCPICFRYFNKILKSECCSNYICHHCLRDIFKKSKSESRFAFCCVFCQKKIPSYVDAEDELDEIKRYTDSPCVVQENPNTQQLTKKNQTKSVSPFGLPPVPTMAVGEDKENRVINLPPLLQQLPNQLKVIPVHLNDKTFQKTKLTILAAEERENQNDIRRTSFDHGQGFGSTNQLNQDVCMGDKGSSTMNRKYIRG